MHDCRMLRPEHSRPPLRDLPEVGPGDVPVPEILRDHREVVGEHHPERIRFARSLTGFERFLEDPAGRHRIARPHIQAGELPHRGQQLRVTAGEPGPAELDGAFEEGERPVRLPAAARVSAR